MADLLEFFSLDSALLSEAFLIGSTAAAMTFIGLGLVVGDTMSIFLFVFMAVIAARLFTSRLFAAAPRAEPL